MVTEKTLRGVIIVCDHSSHMTQGPSALAAITCEKPHHTGAQVVNLVYEMSIAVGSWACRNCGSTHDDDGCDDYDIPMRELYSIQVDQ